MTIVHRVTARVLPITPDGQVLLIQGHDPRAPEAPYWFTPGGGLEDGESSAQGAARELFEETGLQVDADSLGEPIGTDQADVPFDGVLYRQHQTYFGLIVSRYPPHPAGLDADELRSVTAIRWWTLAELAAQPEPVYPPQLAQLVTTALNRWLADGSPAPG